MPPSEPSAVEHSDDELADGAELQWHPRVSVVIPTFDNLDMPCQALAALAAESLTSEAIEIVVVDDGSADGTWEYLASDLVAANVRAWRQPHIGRAGPGRNLGLSHATGEYVFVHDDDDYLGERALEHLLGVAGRTNAEPSNVALLDSAPVSRRRPSELFAGARQVRLAD